MAFIKVEEGEYEARIDEEHPYAEGDGEPLERYFVAHAAGTAYSPPTGFLPPSQANPASAELK